MKSQLLRTQQSDFGPSAVFVGNYTFSTGCNEKKGNQNTPKNIVPWKTHSCRIFEMLDSVLWFIFIFILSYLTTLKDRIVKFMKCLQWDALSECFLYNFSFLLNTKQPFHWNRIEPFSHSLHSSLKADFLKVGFFFSTRNRPHGGKWSLVGVLSWALSNKGNYSRLLKLMDPTEGSVSSSWITTAFSTSTSSDTPDQRSPHAGWPQTTAAIKKSQLFDNVHSISLSTAVL